MALLSTDLAWTLNKQEEAVLIIDNNSQLQLFA